MDDYNDEQIVTYIADRYEGPIQAEEVPNWLKHLDQQLRSLRLTVAAMEKRLSNLEKTHKRINEIDSLQGVEEMDTMKKFIASKTQGIEAEINRMVLVPLSDLGFYCVNDKTGPLLLKNSQNESLTISIWLPDEYPVVLQYSSGQRNHATLGFPHRGFPILSNDSTEIRKSIAAYIQACRNAGSRILVEKV